MSFDTCFNRLITNEGGYSWNEKDPGGETNWGISKRYHPTVDIKALTRDGAKAIYLAEFWIAGNMAQFDDALAFQAFDAAVNHGIPNAIRFVQRAVGTADDGHIGPVTLAAVKAMPPAKLVFRFFAERAEFWSKLSTWSTFGVGWMRRLATDLRFAAEDV